MPAHTQLHDRRSRRFFEDAASRWNNRRKQMDNKKFNLTSSFGFGKESESGGNFESVPAMRSTDHFFHAFDQNNLNSVE